MNPISDTCVQVIAEKCRVLVYNDDESVAPSESSGTAGREAMEFDPLKLSESAYSGHKRTLTVHHNREAH